MTKQEAIDQAIQRVLGQDIVPGRTVGTLSRPLTMTLLCYEGDNAICECVKDGKITVPRSELFDPNKVVNVANHLLNMGFWEEGMESIVLR